MIAPRISVAVLLAASTFVIGCSDSSDSKPSNPPPVTPDEAVGYSATIHRTEAHFPHIIASDWGSLGFGTGYAGAQDNFCIMAENVLRVRGQLSEYLGPDDGNLTADLFRQYMIQSGMYDMEVSTELEYMYAGFAAGFNRYLLDTGVDNIPDAECRGADWIRQMSAQDVKRAELTPAFLPQLAQLFLAAQPPANVAKVEDEKSLSEDSGRQPTADRQHVVEARPEQPELSKEEKQLLIAQITNMATGNDKGSNGIAIGRDLTNHDGGILFTNPHVDWDQTFLFFPRHQIIPGVTNLLGSTTYERNLVGFGTNGDVAWTNTVSPSRTQSLYELELAPGNPTAYLFDGEEEAMKRTDVSVKVLGSDGNITEENHTFYESRHGLLVGLLFSWDQQKAFAIRIADEANRGQNGQIIALARAKSVHDVLAASNKYAASANTHTLAADRHGEALYGDLGPIANFTDDQLQDCASDTPVAISFFAPAFYGNTSDCEWNTDPDSAADGLLGASKHPSLIRTDYVINSNDSYWLVNPEELIEGIPAVVGKKEHEQEMRSRSGHRMMLDRIEGSEESGSSTFDLDSVVELGLSNQHYTGQILRDDLVTLCENNPSVELEGSTVDISEACQVLASWDLRSNLDSRGAHLFREFLRAVAGSVSFRTLPENLNYAVPFDLDDPINTPRGLDTQDNPVALEALARASQSLAAAGIALDARLGDVQTVSKNDQVIPMHGGEQGEGVFNKMSMDFEGSDGYPAVTGSSGSWIMAVEFADEGLRAKGILTYSMSSSSESPHYADMTELFSNKELIDLPYTLEDVEAAALSTAEISEGTLSCSDGGWEVFAEPSFADEDACREYYVELEANQLFDFVDE